MGQNREPKSKSTQLGTINFRQSERKYTMGEKKSLKQLVLGKLDM